MEILCAALGFGATVHAAEPDPAATTTEAPATPPVDTERHLWLDAVVVPWGMNPTRSGAGATLRYKIPLSQDPGVLWRTTNITLGVTDFYAWVFNREGVFVEVTPIAIFNVKAQFAHEWYMVQAFDGGLRRLTTRGREALAAHQVKRGDPNSVDWIDGKNNRTFFDPTVDAHGYRFTTDWVLQAEYGPIAGQYKLIFDYANRAFGRFKADDVTYDPSSLILRRMQDWRVAQEGTLVYTFDIPKNAVRAGLAFEHQYIPSTKLESLSLYAVALYTPRWDLFGERYEPWAALRLGTNVIDAMHQLELTWVLAGGVNVKIF